MDKIGYKDIIVIMGRLFKIFLITLCMFLVSETYAAVPYKILVLPDNIQFENANSIIYPDAATVFASDFINELKKTGNFQVASMSQVRESLRKNKKLAQVTKKALNEYKFSYNISFADLKYIARYYGADTILLVTSQTDTQNYIMRRTVWDFINIPGTTPVDPIYKLATCVSLIDIPNEYVIWNKTFYKKIATTEYRIIPSTFAPSTEQLKKIKRYSEGTLAPIVATNVITKVLPQELWPKELQPKEKIPKDKQLNNIPIKNFSFKFINIKKSPQQNEDIIIIDEELVPAVDKTGTKSQKAKKSKKSFIQQIKNTDFFKNFTLPDEEPLMDEDEDPIINDFEKPKTHTPIRQNNTDFGVMMNGL